MSANSSLFKINLSPLHFFSFNPINCSNYAHVEILVNKIDVHQWDNVTSLQKMDFHHPAPNSTPTPSPALRKSTQTLPHTQVLSNNKTCLINLIS